MLIWNLSDEKGKLSNNASMVFQFILMLLSQTNIRWCVNEVDKSKTISILSILLTYSSSPSLKKYLLKVQFNLLRWII